MPKLGDLFVQVSARGVGKANQGLDQTEQKAKLAGKATQFLKTALLAIGSYAVINAIKSVITSFTDYTVQIDKFTKQTGLATDKVQKLVYAAEQEHSSLEALNKGLMNLTIRLGYCGDGLATYIRYFKTLGVEYKNADGTLRNAYDVFLELSDVMSTTADNTERNAAVTQLFGARAGKELIPLLKKGRHWFEEMGNEAENLGIVLEEKVIKQGKVFSDQMTRLKGAVDGLKYAIAEDLIPTLIQLADTVKSLKPLYDFFKKIDELWQVKIGNWKLNIMDLRVHFEYLYKALRTLGIISKTASDEEHLQGFGNLVNDLGKDGGLVDKFNKKLKTNKESFEDAIKVYRTWLSLNQKRDESMRQLNKESEKETQHKKDSIEMDPELAENKANDINLTNQQTEASELFTTSMNGIVESYRLISMAVRINAAQFQQWSQMSREAIQAVIIKLLALLAVSKLLSMIPGMGGMGGIFQSLAGTIGGLFQTPRGDMWAYKEGRDMGKFFFGGMQERMSSMMQGINVKQQPMNIVIHTGDPSTHVEFLSNMPVGYKSKIYRDVVKEAQELES